VAKKKKMMTIWKRVPRSALKQYYARGEPILLTHKRIDANEFQDYRNAGLLWEWDCSDLLFDYVRDPNGHHGELAYAVSSLLCPSGYLTSRQMAINAWREEWCDNDYSEPVFWVKHYTLMKKAKKHYD